ncbi:LysR family transcriptional regulator [Aquabacterium sp.]|uniref:LysR family transcriptional regulator n=1 Tax=Aquabacterium sp. TaxID=1872578 RepID=UPI002B6B76AE|nr:LysR family transcriptional regulator [Aquabacterium sp.]HSW09068.1 LysR family transcriptional regulator [Aquabacterium sp.]
MNTLRNLRSFVAVARSGSLAVAADRIALTAAAVSLQLRALEAEFRRELFLRGGRNLVLNDAGRELLPWAERLVALHDEMRSITSQRAASAGTPIVGTYRVGSIVSAVAPLSRVVVGLKREHPQLEVTLSVARSIDMAAACASGALDAAVLVRGDARPARGLAWTPLYSEALVLAAHAGVRGRDALRQLAEHPFLRFERQQRTGALVQRALRQHRVKVQEFLELNSIEAIVELVRQRVGVTLLPQLAHARWDEDPALRLLSLPGPALQREIGLLQRRDRAAVPAQAIIAALRP